MRITLTEGFAVMSEGVQVLKVTDASYDADFGIVQITMNNKAGARHKERFNLLDKDGQQNPTALGSFSSFVRAAMGSSDIADIDPAELKDHFVKTTIGYREYTDKDGNTKKTTCKAKGAYWEHPTDDDIKAFTGKTASNLDILDDDLF